MDTIQRKATDQNLRKLAGTAGFSDIYAQDYVEYFEVFKVYTYFNEKNITLKTSSQPLYFCTPKTIF